MNDYIKDTNIPTPPRIGVYNDFVAPISSQDVNTTPKKDIVRGLLIFLFVISIIVAISTFLYIRLLSNQVDNLKTQLFNFDNSNTVSLFENNLPEMRSLSQKLKLINSVYDSKSYIASMLFPTIESLVESSNSSYIYFDKFSLKKDTKSNLVSISLSGVAMDYLSLYRQINNFKANNVIKNFKLASLSINQENNVDFDISFDTDITTTSYLSFLDAHMSSSSEIYKNISGPLFKNKNPVNAIPLSPTSSTSTNLVPGDNNT